MKIDLHLHSYYSADGVHSASELLDYFNEGDIAGIADHETIGGWKVFKDEALKREIIPVFGVEWFSLECHILSYFIKSVPQKFLKFIEERRAQEKKCMITVYEKIKKTHNRIPSYEDIIQSQNHPENILGLPALAQAISKIEGISKMVAEDEVRNEKRKMPSEHRPMPFLPEQIISLINDWGAFPVLAHPFRNFGGKSGRQDKEEVEEKVNLLVQKGLKGLEIYSGSANMEEKEFALKLCKKYKLIPTVGSDFHYDGKGLKPTKLEDTDIDIYDNFKRLLGSMK